MRNRETVVTSTRKRPGREEGGVIEKGSQEAGKGKSKIRSKKLGKRE